MVAVLDVDGVKVEVHVVRVQVVKVPVTLVTLRATVPVGGRNVPAVDVSVTVTSQVDA